jgi:rhomboid protease GluP
MATDQGEINGTKTHGDAVRNERPVPPSLVRRAWVAARAAPVTVSFLAVCVAVFAVAELHGSTTDTWTLIRFGALDRGDVWSGQWWRLITCAFLHIGIVHLAWNLFGMFGWCSAVERALGSARFALLYLATAVAASAASLLFHDVVSAGASGAGFGMIGAWLTLTARGHGSWRAMADDPRVRRFVGSMVVWTVVMSTMNVDNAAHAGGFAAGIALCWALTMPAGSRGTARRWARLGVAACVVLPVALAAIPRPGATRFGVPAFQAALVRAVEQGDLQYADRLLAAGQAAGYRSLRASLRTVCSAGDARVCAWLEAHPTAGPGAAP